MFTPDCVYNVCFQFCKLMGPEPSHSVVDKPETALSDFLLRYICLFYKKHCIGLTYTLILIFFLERS